MKIKLLISIMYLLFSIPVSCMAADEKLFDTLDANKDGKLTKEEVVKSDLTVVTGKDGTKQVQQRNRVKDTQGAAMTTEEKQKLFETIDQNKDGSVSQKEWNRASPNGFVLWRF